MDGFADQDAKDRSGGRDLDADPVPAGLSVEPGIDGVRVACDVRPQFVTKGLQVVLDANDLGADSLG